MQKRILSLILFFLIGILAFSQEVENRNVNIVYNAYFNYKAVIYDGGNPLQNQSVDIKFTILENTTTILYEETHTTTTDNNGIVILLLGDGTPLGSEYFEDIEWSSQSYSLKVEVDTGSGYQDLGTSVLQYVPYAKFAAETEYAVYADNADIANSAGSADYATTAGNVPTNTSELVNDSGFLTSETDGDITNELQTLAISGNTLSISDGNSVTLPSSSGESDSDFLVVGTGVASNNNSDNIYHEGSISVGHDGESHAKVHIKNIDSDIDDYENTGIYVHNNNTSETDKIGIKLEMEAPPTNNTAIVYGVKNNILDNGDSDIYGEYTSIGGLNGDGNHFGNYISLQSDGYGTHTGSKVNMLTGAQGVLIGYDLNINTLDPSNNQALYGLKTKISGLATGTKYAVSNVINGDAAGNVFGVKNDISNTGNGNQYGVYNKMSGTGTNKHYGSYTKISGVGSGDQIGYTTNNYNSGNGVHYGAYNYIYGNGSGEHIGVKNQLSGQGTGNQIGVRNMISNTNGTNQYGVYTTLDAASGNSDRFATKNDLFGAGDGNLYGVGNQLSNPGSGAHTGTYNNIYGDGSGTHYGTKNALSGSGTGVQYGNYTVVDNLGDAEHTANYNQLSGAGNGIQYGSKTIVDNSGNNIHYGNYIEMSGAGSGDKYGVYSKIPTSTNGTHYAIYGEAEKAGSYAGYFKGRVDVDGPIVTESVYTTDIHLSGEVTLSYSGSANMIAYIYGSVDAYYIGGNIITEGSSSGFSMNRLSEGKYEISMTSVGDANNYIVNATLNEQGLIWISDKTSSSFVINTKDGFGSSDWADLDFQFVVYKK